MLRSPTAVAIQKRLKYQNARWLLTEFPDYLRQRRQWLRSWRQKRVACQKKLQTFTRRHPRLIRLLVLSGYGIGIVFVLGAAWFIYQAILFESSKVNGHAGRRSNREFWELIGLLPVFFGYVHLLFMSIFWSSPLKAFPVPIRHLVLNWKFHLFAVVFAGVYAIPITCSAESPGGWLLSMLVNVLLVSAGSFFVQQVGIWLIGRRKSHLLWEEKRRTRRVFRNSGAMLGILLLVFAFLLFLAHGIGIDVQLPVEFFQGIAAGRASWYWVAGWIVAAAGVLGVTVPMSLKARSFAYRKRLVRGMRFEGKTPIKELRKLGGAEEQLSLAQMRDAIEKKFALRRSKLRLAVRRIFSFDPLLLVWLVFLVIMQGWVIYLLSVLGQSGADVRMPVEVPESLFLTQTLLIGWLAVESAAWFRHFGERIRPGEARLLSPWKMFKAAHLSGVPVYLQILMLSSPLIVAAVWFPGHQVTNELIRGLVVVTLSHLIFRNVWASIGVLSQVKAVLPRWKRRQWFDLVLLVVIVAAAIGVGVAIQMLGWLSVYVALLALSFVFFAVSVGVRHAYT